MLLSPRARVFLLTFSTLMASCASLTSRTEIAPGQSFRLGGGQAGAFVVRGKNAGPVPIIVFAERGGKRDSLLTLAPGAPVDARFPGSATAVFMNISSTQTASVAIKVTGDIGNLGMTYEASARR